MDHADWADVILIGPGLGRNVETVKLLRNLYTAIEKPMVIDADGFSPFYQDISLIKHLKNEYVFTPHLGELGSLFNVNTEELKANIIDYIEKITTDIPGVLVAKGASTLISDGYNGYINSTGNSGLATAGTGDVLSGVIASFISQGYNLLDSSLISTYIHGYAAEKKSKKISQRGLIASDLLIEIGKKLSDYEL
jgi:NAD(P)H-hydrate epimerase